MREEEEERGASSSSSLLSIDLGILGLFILFICLGISREVERRTTRFLDQSRTTTTTDKHDDELAVGFILIAPSSSLSARSCLCTYGTVSPRNCTASFIYSSTCETNR